jgi:large repetitive protein
MPKVINLKAPDGDNLVFFGQSLNDTLIAGNGIQTLYGTAGDDLLIAGTGDQALYGGSDNDTLIAGKGNQILDGGSGVDTLDFSRLSGKLLIDPDLYVAQIVDPASGAVIYNESVKSVEKIIGTNDGNDFHARANTANTFIGGNGDDIYRSESGGDTVTLGAGADTFGWFRKYVAVGHTDRITDFQVGNDKLDLRDFLKGQTIKNPAYSDVVHLVDTIDQTGSHGTLVQGLVSGAWYDVAVLDGVDVTHVTVSDLARL